MLLIDSYKVTRAGRSGLPPAAPLPVLLQTLACRLRPLSYLGWCRARYGDRFVVYPVDMPPLVFLCDPSDIRAIFTAPDDVLNPGAGAMVAAPLFGADSFMLHEGDAHMRVRTTIAPSFHKRAVEANVEMTKRLIDEELKSWPFDTVFPTHDALRGLTLRIILRTIFGEENDTHRALHRSLLDMLSVTASLVLQEPRVRHLPGWRQTWRRFTERSEQADRLIFELIARRRGEGARAGAMLDMLLDMHGQGGVAVSDRELRDHLVSTIIAGHETTASALAWAVQLLAHNRRVQTRLAEEIDADTDERYLDATTHEVLRRSPVFLFAAPRAVMQPIEIGGWTYRPPAHLLGCTYLMHHDPALYPNPHEFRPERFLGGVPSARRWLPWGGGRKVCLGRHLAMQEIRLVLRALVAEREIEPARRTIERPSWRSVMVAPSGGSRVVLRRRRRSRSRSAAAPATVGCSVEARRTGEGNRACPQLAARPLAAAPRDAQ